MMLSIEEQRKRLSRRQAREARYTVTWTCPHCQFVVDERAEGKIDWYEMAPRMEEMLREVAVHVRRHDLGIKPE